MSDSPHWRAKIRSSLCAPRALGFILLAATVVRLLWLALVPARPLSDFLWYYEHGLGIASGRGYALTLDNFPLMLPGNPLPAPRLTAFWPVGYPGFLGVLFHLTSGLGHPLGVAKLANVALDVVGIGAMAYATNAIFESVLAGRAVALLLAFLPNHIAYTSLTSVEIYFFFLSASAIALLVRAEREPARGAA